jgi:hypothetical protein
MEKIIEQANEVQRRYGSADLDYVARRLGVDIHEELRARNL